MQAPQNDVHICMWRCDMTHWMCGGCGYYVSAPVPPKRCPGCSATCVFRDVTCYRPECGGEGNMDPLLVGAALRDTVGEPVRVKPEQTLAITEAVCTVELFAGLSEKERWMVESLGRHEFYVGAAIMCTKGAEARKLYIVEDGLVAMQSDVGNGASASVRVLSSSEAFGWSALVPPYLVTATAVALTDTHLLAIQREALLRLMRAEPSLGLAILQNLSAVMSLRLRRLEKELLELARR